MVLQRHKVVNVDHPLKKQTCTNRLQIGLLKTTLSLEGSLHKTTHALVDPHLQIGPQIDEDRLEETIFLFIDHFLYALGIIAKINGNFRFEKKTHMHFA